MGFELGTGRTGGPEHPLDPETGRYQLTQNRGPGAIGREVPEEVRRLPVRDSGQDPPMQSAQDLAEQLAYGRWVGRERSPDVARIHPLEDREVFDPLHVA